MKPLSNMVEVWEAWHLPSSKTAGDGWHSIVVGDVELVGEKWTHDFFPFVFLRFSNRVLGFWAGRRGATLGHSGGDEPAHPQRERAARRKGRGRIYAPYGSKIVPAQPTNGVADIVTYSGACLRPSTTATPWRPRSSTKSSACGSSPSRSSASASPAAAKKPSGRRGGGAARVQRHRERAFRGPPGPVGPVVPRPGGNLYRAGVRQRRARVQAEAAQQAVHRRFDWKDIDLQRDDFIMQMFPVCLCRHAAAALPAREGDDAGRVHRQGRGAAPARLPRHRG